MIKRENTPRIEMNLKIQLKFTTVLLQHLFGRYNKITNELIQLIMDFVFSSPYRKNNIFLFAQGKITIIYNLNNQLLSTNKINNQIKNQKPQYSHFDSINSKIITASNPIPLEEKVNYILANKYYHNQKIFITKIWNKPPTKTQKKILTYCGKFKQFLLGNHLAHKTIDLRFLKRQFMIPFHQLQEFQKHFNNVKQNDVHFCSFDVIDSYMALVTRSWIEVEIQMNEPNDKQQKIYKVIPQGCDPPQILSRVFMKFQEKDRKWYLQGKSLNIWQQKNVWSRKQTVVRTLQGKVDLIEGSSTQNIDSLQIYFQ